MTNDAKMGLLLGFLLIIAIVFAVNGLPKFIKASDVGTSQGQDVVSHKPIEDLMAIARKTARRLEEKPEVQAVPLKPRPEGTAYTNIIKKHFFREYYAAGERVDKTVDQGSEQSYVVQANDTLADIAKKFYGPEEGNRLVNVDKIAKFNQLKSANFIYQGQKLNIPSLGRDIKDNFVAVKTITPQNKPDNEIRNIIELPLVSATHRLGSRFYVVRQGDTLWAIAAKTLGSGDRYVDIVKANKFLRNADDLAVGMKLTLPAIQ